MRFSRPGQRYRGVILLDVIVAAIVLAIGMTLVVSLSTESLMRQVDGENRMKAAWLADELLSMVVVEGPDEFLSGSPSSWMGSAADDGRFEPPFDNFRYEMDIEQVGDYQPFLVTATVRWPRSNGMGEVAVSTKIARRHGEEEEELPREPLEPLDRDARYYDDEDSP